MADTLCEVQLSPERSVSFATEPGGEQLEQHAYAGLARFSVSPPGTYRLSVDQPLWLDVMLKGQVIAAKDFQAHAGCNAPHQVVEFDLPFADALSAVSYTHLDVYKRQTNTYSIGGSISGLSQNGLVLTDNGGNPLSISSGSSAFTFSNHIAYGSSYAVAIGTQPTGQTCSVSSGSGTVTGAVSSVAVSCATNTYSIGGSVSGLSQSGLMLTDNGGNALGVISGSSSFTFSNQLAYGASYAVAVSTQPTGQTCTVGSGSGTVTAAVTSVTVSCTTNTLSLIHI